MREAIEVRFEWKRGCDMTRLFIPDEKSEWENNGSSFNDAAILLRVQDVPLRSS